jgi:hypothetical protein
MPGYPLVKSLVFAAVLALAYSVVLSGSGTGANGNVTLEIAVGSYPPGQDITGNVSIKYNRLVPRNSVLNAYIDGNLTSSVTLDKYLRNVSSDFFEPHDFSYKIFGEGVNRWADYPSQRFWYRIEASGVMLNGTPWGPYIYPPLGSDPAFLEETITADEGMKFIRNGSLTIFEPEDSNRSRTQWSVYQTVPSSFEVVMRKACGGQSYSTFPVSPDGFVRRKLLCTQSECNSEECIGGYCRSQWNGEGTSVWRVIEHTDIPSLNETRTLYWKGNEWSLFDGYRASEWLPGGIYKNWERQEYGVDVVWEEREAGTYIEIRNYDYESRYDIVYAPPGGPLVCAHTDVSEEHVLNWNVESEQYNSSVSYGGVYVCEYSKRDLPPKPDCPPEPSKCIERKANNYTAVEVHDPDDAVVISSEYNSTLENLTVIANTTLTGFSGHYIDTVDFSEFSDFRSGDTGNHTLMFELADPSGAVLANSSAVFSVCVDSDSDGYCSIEEGGKDCNDTKSKIRPGAEEECNGLDDDCDGDIDEDFWRAGSKLGNPCGTGACEGVFVCTPDGSNTVCSNTVRPGDQKEICDNGVDDDCDGVVDERVEVTGEQGCFCKTGDTDRCGSNIGICKAGVMTCAGGVWGDCEGGVEPRDEICNSLDDDCDGVVDDVNNGDSVSSTHCRCYGGGLPTEEACNDIDDNCNGLVDEGVKCCSTDDVRPCNKLGACSSGMQRCVDGLWSECDVKPIDEICYNEIDDDCDGDVDEYCSPEYSCNNGIKDINEDGVDCGGPCPNMCEVGIPWTLMITAGILILIVLAVLVLYFRSKGKEMTWEELRKRWTPAS